MSKKGRLAIGIACGLALLLGVGVAVGAGSSLNFRIVLPDTKTASSGTPEKPDHTVWVRVNKTMSTKLEDRYYAIRGIEFCGTRSQTVRVIPSFVNDKADRNVRNDYYGYATYTPKHSAELPDGYHMTAIRICTDEDGPGGDIKGVKIWGAKLDSLGRPVQPMGPVKYEQPKCKAWKQKVSCPAGMIAHSLDIYSPLHDALKLRCSKLEPDVGSAAPVVGEVQPSNFMSSSGTLALDVKVKNDTHTTATVNLVSASLVRGDDTLCMGKKTGLTKALPTGYDYTQRITMSCDWAKIKSSGNCKLGATCNASFKGQVRATVSGNAENHDFAGRAVITKR